MSPSFSAVRPHGRHTPCRQQLEQETGRAIALTVRTGTTRSAVIVALDLTGCGEAIAISVPPV
jgi:hypothetical protein